MHHCVLFMMVPGSPELEIRSFSRTGEKKGPPRKGHRRCGVPGGWPWPAFALLISLSVVLGCDGSGTGPGPDAMAAGSVEVSPASVFLMEGLAGS